MTWIGLDPGRSKCGLVRSEQTTGQIEVAAVLSPEECFKQIAIWRERPGLEGVVLGDGTGSKHWQRQLNDLGLALRPASLLMGRAQQGWRRPRKH